MRSPESPSPSETEPSTAGVQHGTLRSWDDARGFGFITPDGSDGQRVFVHIHDFASPWRRPVVGDVLHYVLQRDAHDRLHAVQVCLPGEGTHS